MAVMLMAQPRRAGFCTGSSRLLSAHSDEFAASVTALEIGLAAGGIGDVAGGGGVVLVSTVSLRDVLTPLRHTLPWHAPRERFSE